LFHSGAQVFAAFYAERVQSKTEDSLRSQIEGSVRKEPTAAPDVQEIVAAQIRHSQKVGKGFFGILTRSSSKALEKGLPVASKEKVCLCSI